MRPAAPPSDGIHPFLLSLYRKRRSAPRNPTRQTARGNPGVNDAGREGRADRPAGKRSDNEVPVMAALGRRCGAWAHGAGNMSGSARTMTDEAGGSIAARVAALDWPHIAADLDTEGWAVLPGLLTAQECGTVAGLYESGDNFRSRVVMARHGFGRGEYQYFAYPLPAPVAALRETLYGRLAPVANRWNTALGVGICYPAVHAAFLARCHEAGQTRPTPLLLQYGPGDYNCLHQDLYGEHVFPLQVAILLSEPGEDFTGGEFVLAEQRPRMQSRVAVVPLRRGDAVAFAVRHRPVQGTRGVYRTVLRHGVSSLRSGRRHTLGIIFHDAT